MKCTIDRLTTVASHSLALHDGVRNNTCDAVVGEAAALLEDDVTAYAPMKAPVEGAKHFVALIPAAETTSDAEYGYIVLDPTIQQFEEKLGTTLPDIAVLEPGDARRGQWYDYIERP